MADTTVPIDIPIKPGDEIKIKMGVVKIYQGQAVGLVVGTGYAVNLVPATAGMKFIGIAEETVDNSGGAAGDLSIRVKRKGITRPTQSGIVQADVGKDAYWTDNQTISTTRGAIYAGTIVTVNANDAKVDVDITNAVAPAVDHAGFAGGLVLPTVVPNSPLEGSTYFNTSDSKIYVYHSAAWIKTAALS